MARVKAGAKKVAKAPQPRISVEPRPYETVPRLEIDLHPRARAFLRGLVETGLFGENEAVVAEYLIYERLRSLFPKAVRA